MDTVILAAGGNERLRGIVPAYHKPLLIINGKPIILDLAEKALQQNPGDKIIIVCSQHNIAALVDLFSQFSHFQQRTRFVIQAKPSGPIEALSLGLEIVKTQHVLVLCGDNIISDFDWEKFTLEYDRHKQPWMTIMVDKKPLKQAERFTVIREDINGKDVDFLNHVMPDWEQPITCWIGPVILRTTCTRAVLPGVIAADRKTFATLFTAMFEREDSYPVFVEGHALDIGVPEALK